MSRSIARPGPRRRPARLVTALALGCLALPGCGGAPHVAGAGSRSIVVITLDTTRADHMHAYGYPLPITPTIDDLASRGVLFEDAYAPMPQTLPAHATIFTGLDPRQHGALENTYKLDDHYHTLAEEAVERGYATGAFVAAKVLDRETGIDQGFLRFDEPPGTWNAEREGHPPQRPAAAVTDAALGWADELDAAEPFLLWAHYYDPHGDGPSGFAPPPEALAAVPFGPVRKLLQQRAAELQDSGLDDAQLASFWHGYAAEILAMDGQVGRLLDGLRQRGLLEDAVIVVVGDHGEGLWEHGIKAHGVHVWEELLRVPLIVVHPDGERAGLRVQGRATLRDIVPTLESMAWGITRGGDDDLGIDLWTAAAAGSLPDDRPTILERPHYDEQRVKRRPPGQPLDEAYGFLTAILMGQYKLIEEPGGTQHLYDLAADPGELVDIAAEHPDLTARMSRLLADWKALNPVGKPGEDIELTPERRAILEALGYLDGGDEQR